MLLEFLLALALGILVGTFTGLSPGIHINLIASVIVTNLTIFKAISPLSLVIFIVAMSIAHTFIDFIPSTYLGVPEEDTFLSMLPAQKMLLEGKAHQAIKLALTGALIGVTTIALLSPFIITLTKFSLSFITKLIPFIIIFLSAYLILKEEKFILAFIIFSLSGIIGYFSFSLPIKEPLFPLLTGLFGISSIFLSLKTPPVIPKQKPTIRISVSKKEVIKNVLGLSLISPIFSILPGLSSSHLTTIISQITKPKSKSFILLNGMTNSALMCLTFLVLYSINKARSGSAVAISSILQTISPQDLSIILLTIALSAIISFFLGIKLSKIFSKLSEKINYILLSKIILIILISLTPIISNPLGLITLFASFSLSIFSILSNIKRIHLMGCLIIPTLFFYIF